MTRFLDVLVREPHLTLGHEVFDKYRCPAWHEGWKCPRDKVCNAGKTYGLTVRVKREIDVRRFPPIPRSTKQLERKDKGRTAVERINARLLKFRVADDGNIPGSRRNPVFQGAEKEEHAAFATVPTAAPSRYATLGRMRLSPRAPALRQKLIA